VEVPQSDDDSRKIGLFADLKVKFRNQKQGMLLVMYSIVHVKFMKITNAKGSGKYESGDIEAA